jgi:serine/threonine protein kinase
MKGSLLYDMLTGKPPFYSKNKHEILKNITSKSVPLPDYLSQDSKSLLRELFRIKPKDRIGSKAGAEEIMKNKFFTDIDFDALENKLVKPPISFIDNDINANGFDENF